MSIRLHIPVFSERLQRPGERKTYRITPAFPTMLWRDRERFEVFHPREDRALEELTRILRREFNELAKDMRHDALLRWSFYPDLTAKKIPVHLLLRKQSVTGEVFAVTYNAMGRRIVSLPKLPALTFDLERGNRLEDRANEVLTKYFRREEKRHEGKLDLDQYLSSGLARLATVDLTIRTRQEFHKEDSTQFAFLGGTEKMSGAQELEKVGRCLNRLFPQRLSRAVLRDEKVEALQEHFGKSQREPQPLVLLGASQSGKSAIIEEYLYRSIAEEIKPVREVWLVSPQRLISGMSFVGQWEERAHVIFQEARQRKHILYFEDLPGLFQAGKSRDSDLTVGHVLKAYFEEGGLRVLAEATPDGWRKLRELDRGFADFFRSLPVEETSRRDTLRILIRTVQELEGTNPEVEFKPDLIPAVYELQNRFSRSRAFPGKAVEVIHQLAHKSDRQILDYRDVFSFFQARTGIRQQLLRQDFPAERRDIAAFFNSRIKGQPRAVEAMSDLVVRILSQLNEPGRPLSSLLFLGPTGVGKSESAKSLAEYFFGTAERILRFDMNEFVGPDAAERLIGSTFRPRGLLTAAIRRQPYSVILLDEIEKAHHRVFDLLLQLLDDGRLTDASGETADFCNAVVVMTSNLGARSARHQLGFGESGKDDSEVYREAAQQFFRPEFFNRLDEVVPFGELSREDIESLVALMSSKSLSRAGLSETQLNLKIQPDVHARLAEIGFKPEFGARALRRAVEEFLIEPLALRISELPKNRPAVVTCSCNSEGGLDFAASDLRAKAASGHMPKEFPLSQCSRFVEKVNEFLEKIEDDLESWRIESDGVIDPTDPVQLRYFALRENIVAIRRMRDHFIVTVDKEIKHRREHPGKPSPNPSGGNSRFLADHDPDQFLARMYQTSDPARFLQRAVNSAEPFDHIREMAGDIINRANSTGLMVSHNPGEEQRCLIEVRGPDRRDIMRYWQYALKNWFDASEIHRAAELVAHPKLGVVEHSESVNSEVFTWEDYWNTAVLVAEGPTVFDLIRSLHGTSLLICGNGKVSFAGIFISTLPGDWKPADLKDRLLNREAEEEIERYEVATIQCDEAVASIDLASGFVTNQSEHRIWKFINPHLPVAEELSEFVEMF